MLPMPAKRYRKEKGRDAKQKHCYLWKIYKVCIKTSLSGILDIVFQYGDAVATTTLDKLQRLQNRAARIATNSQGDTPSQLLIKELGWSTIKELIEIDLS